MTALAIVCGTTACASRGVERRLGFVSNPPQLRARALPSKDRADPAEKVRDAVRSLREGIGSGAAKAAEAVTGQPSGTMGSSPPAASGTSGGWSSVEVTTPPPPPSSTPATPRTWLTLATRSLPRTDLGWTIVAGIALCALTLAYLISRRSRRA